MIDSMALKDTYEIFPDADSCISFLESIKWANKPVCPYCSSNSFSELKEGHRYHCNTCNTSYSVTVGTLFHKTKAPLQKWFTAIKILLNPDVKISVRELAMQIEVTKDTAWRMEQQIKEAILKRDYLVNQIYDYGQ